jgi:hypothetical protein
MLLAFETSKYGSVVFVRGCRRRIQYNAMIITPTTSRTPTTPPAMAPIFVLLPPPGLETSDVSVEVEDPLENSVPVDDEVDVRNLLSLARIRQPTVMLPVQMIILRAVVGILVDSFDALVCGVRIIVVSLFADTTIVLEANPEPRNTNI